MLREFVEKNHYLFAEGARDWEEAILMSCQSLEADGTVESNYAHDIVDCVRKYGPYIVIMPNVALPHSQEGRSQGPGPWQVNSKVSDSQTSSPSCTNCPPGKWELGAACKGLGDV